MDDENGLELSLGLSFGGSSGKSKTKDVQSDPNLEEESRNKRMGNISDVSFKNFFQTGITSQEHSSEEKSDPVLRQQEKFWTALGKSSVPGPDSSNDMHGNQSEFARHQQLWAPTSKVTDSEDEKSGSSKRKLPFEEKSFQRKHEKVVEYVESRGKSPVGTVSMKNSRVSVTTEDGSTGENDDAAESEAEGSNSWLVSQHEDTAKGSDIHKFSNKRASDDPSGLGSQGQKHSFVTGNGSSPELGKVTYGIPLSLQPLPVMSVPYPVPVKVSTPVSAPNVAGFPQPCVMQLMPLANNERPVVQSINNNSMELAFGYSSVQLPTLETNSSWALGSQPQHLSSFTGRVDGAPNSEHPEDSAQLSHAPVQVPPVSFGASGYQTRTLDLVKGSGKQVGGIGISSSSSPAEASNPYAVEGFPHEGSAIRPGIAGEVKFGGCGSYPDLPWVSTTAPGPNGRTISGVTYKYSKNQVKIVCACHGTHMSPEEFIQHATSDAPIPDNNASMPPFPSSNPAASAQS